MTIVVMMTKLVREIRKCFDNSFVARPSSDNVNAKTDFHCRIECFSHAFVSYNHICSLMKQIHPLHDDNVNDYDLS